MRHHRWPVGLGPQYLVDFIQKTLDATGATFNINKAHPVDSGRTFVWRSNLIATRFAGSARLADRSDHTKRRIETPAPISPSDRASVSES
jgi:hypothetical protein